MQGFMGAQVPKSHADYVTLYCNALSITKISIIQGLLSTWVSKTMKTYSSEQLEILVAEKSFSIWKKTEGQSFETFVKLLQFELRRKKLDPATVGRILNLLNDEKNKDEKNQH